MSDKGSPAEFGSARGGSIPPIPAISQGVLNMDSQYETNVIICLSNLKNKLQTKFLNGGFHNFSITKITITPPPTIPHPSIGVFLTLDVVDKTTFNRTDTTFFIGMDKEFQKFDKEIYDKVLNMIKEELGDLRRKVKDGR